MGSTARPGFFAKLTGAVTRYGTSGTATGTVCYYSEQDYTFATDYSNKEYTATVASICDNGIKEADEECDGSDFGGATCKSEGFGGGDLACSSNCQSITTSLCSMVSGGGDIETVKTARVISVRGQKIICDKETKESLLGILCLMKGY